MATHNPTPSDPLSDDDIGMLIRHSIDGESPPKEFVSSLTNQLDAEFLSLSSSETMAQPSDPSSEVGTGAKSQTLQWTGRSLLALATAAVAVVAAVIWVSQPSYSWASMMLWTCGMVITSGRVFGSFDLQLHQRDPVTWTCDAIEELERRKRDGQ
jgi:hypothetical protein